MINILSGCFIIAGTFFLSKSIFNHHMKMLVNYVFNRQAKLPVFITLAIFTFGYRNKLKDIKFWDYEHVPSEDAFSFEQQWRILEPFVGFICIFIGTGLPVLTGKNVSFYFCP
ncbi:MAG TPA: hypothetical protein VJZ49_11315 [Syntrophales bacterium]|nr:hypothetical protein [Syntrophales bacterium]